MFSLSGCSWAAPPVEESVIKKPAVEEITGEQEEVGETIETKAQGLTSKAPDAAAMDDVKDAIELAAEAQNAGLNEVAEDVLKWAKDALNALVEKALLKDPCSAEIKDVEYAIELAGEAQRLGMDDLADQLITWAKDAFQAVAAKKAASATEAERFELAAEAQKLGLDQLAEDLMAGKPIESPCIYDWDVEITTDYRYVSEGATIESWGSQVKFQNIPLSEAFGQVGQPSIFASQQQYNSRGDLTHEEFAVYDGENWISGTRQGEPLWYLTILPKPEEVEAGEIKTLVISLALDPDSVHIIYGDFAHSYLDFSFECEIPLEKLEEGKPFSTPYDYEYSEEYETLEESADLRFTPSKS